MQKPGLRKPRFTRSQENFPPLHITERDVRILALVERHRFVSSRHVIHMIDGSTQHITRRLGRLFHAGLLQRPRAQSWLTRNKNSHMVCCITETGQAVLREQGLPTFASPPRARGETMALSLHHALRVTEVMLAIERFATASARGFLHHDEWQKPTEARLIQMRWSVSMNYDGKRVRTAVIPDGAFAMEREGKRSFFFIEVDRGTMPVSRSDSHQSSFRRKVLAYKASRDMGVLWKNMGVGGFRVLVVCESVRRQKSLQRATMEVFHRRQSSLFLFAIVSELLSQSGVLDHGWRTCSGETVLLFGDGASVDKRASAQDEPT